MKFLTPICLFTMPLLCVYDDDHHRSPIKVAQFISKSGSEIPNMTFSTRNFDRLTPLAPKFPNFATQILIFRLKHTVAVVTHAHVLQNFYTTWVLGVACQKTTFRSKLGGGAGLGEHPKKL